MAPVTSAAVGRELCGRARVMQDGALRPPRTGAGTRAVAEGTRTRPEQSAARVFAASTESVHPAADSPGEFPRDAARRTGADDGMGAEFRWAAQSGLNPPILSASSPEPLSPWTAGPERHTQSTAAHETSIVDTANGVMVRQAYSSSRSRAVSVERLFTAFTASSSSTLSTWTVTLLSVRSRPRWWESSGVS